MLYKGVDPSFDKFDTVIYDPDNTTKPKQYIRTDGIYLGGFCYSELGQSQPRFEEFALLSDDQILESIGLWISWTRGNGMSNTKLSTREKAGIVAGFLGLPGDFSAALGVPSAVLDTAMTDAPIFIPPKKNNRKKKALPRGGRSKDISVLVMVSHEDPDRPLSAPGQPRFLRISNPKLTQSFTIHMLMDCKNTPEGFDLNDEADYNPRTSREKMEHIQNHVVYLRGLCASVIGQRQAMRDEFTVLEDGEILDGVRVWFNWAEGREWKEGLRRRDLDVALLLAYFLNLPMEYKEALHAVVLPAGT